MGDELERKCRFCFFVVSYALPFKFLVEICMKPTGAFQMRVIQGNCLDSYTVQVLTQIFIFVYILCNDSHSETSPAPATGRGFVFPPATLVSLAAVYDLPLIIRQKRTVSPALYTLRGSYDSKIGFTVTSQSLKSGHSVASP